MSKTRADEVSQPEDAFILTVPMEMFIENVVPVLSHGDIARLSLTCRQMHGFFVSTLREAGAKKLLNAVMCGDWVTVRSISSTNPELIFQLVTMTDSSNGITFNNCSPLIYAFYVRSWFAINIFKNALTTPEQRNQFENMCEVFFPEPLLDEILTIDISPEDSDEAAPFMDLVERWLNDESDVSLAGLKEFLLEQTIQLSSHHQSYSLQPVFWAYMAADILMEELIHHNHPDVITSEKVFSFIDNVLNYAVRRLLTREILHQMLACETDTGAYCWSVNASFADIEPPEYNDYIRDGDAGGYFYKHVFDAKDRFAILDVESVIWRGDSKEAACGFGFFNNDQHFHIFNSVKKDLYILRHLCNTRRSQFLLLRHPAPAPAPEPARCILM